MEKDNWDQLNILYLSEKHSLTKQKEQLLKDEFSADELKIRDAYIEQLRVSENSPAYGSKESKDRAMSASEAKYNHANSLISAKIEQRDHEIQQTIDKCLDRIYEHDGGSRKTAELSHNKWLEEQAKTRTEINDPDIDSRQLSQDERTVDHSSSIRTQFNDPKPSISDDFNDLNREENDIDFEK